MINYNLFHLCKEAPDITIHVRAGELLEMAEHCVSETKKQLEQIIQDSANETYLSPKKTAEQLEVDPSTLWRWDKQNYLKPIQLGGKRRYRKSDIDKILKKED